MRQTVIIVLVTAAVLELNHYLVERGRRKMAAYTIMALLNDLSRLSEKAGHRNLIGYLEQAYGKEEALNYVGRIYGALQKNKVQGEQYALLEKTLRDYLEQYTGRRGEG